MVKPKLAREVVGLAVAAVLTGCWSEAENAVETRHACVYAGRNLQVNPNGVGLMLGGRTVPLAPLSEKGTWTLQNYDKRLQVEFGREIDGVKCLYLGGATTACDTAWHAISPRTPWTGGSRLVLSFGAACTKRVQTPLDVKEGHTSSVRWYDGGGKLLDAHVLSFAVAVGGLNETCLVDSVPQGAASFEYQMGWDAPNLNRGDFAAVSDVRATALGDEDVFVKEGSFESEIRPGGAVSWEAVVPPGTSVGFQVATSDDPVRALTTPFVGPSGTSGSFYTKPFSPKGRFVRYRAVLRSADGTRTPILRRVRVGNAVDCRWSIRPDVRPPRLKLVSDSPTTNAFEVLKFRAEDACPILYETFRARVDGRDETASFVRRGDEFHLTGRREPWSNGLHRVSLELSDCRGNVRKAERVFVIGPKPSVPKITLRDDGMTLVDGKPFFPVGAYAVCKREFNGNDLDRAFDGLRKGGFTMGHTYGDAYADDFLNIADRRGFKLWVRAYQLDPEFFAQGLPCKAVAAWYLADDTSSGTSPELLEDRDAAVKAADSMRLSCQADPICSGGTYSNYEDYVHGTDVFMPEIYPVVKRLGDPSDRTCVAETVRDMERCYSDRRDFGDGRPHGFWPIIQYFKGWDGWGHFPTREQLFGMTWAAVVHGAHGVLWYTYGGFDVPARGWKNEGITSSPERWRNICELASQLTGLADVLSERTGVQPPTPVVAKGPQRDPFGQPSVTCLVKRHGGCTYLFSVNAAPEPVTARFSLDGASGAADVLFENGRKVAVKGGELTDDFAPFGVHIYRIGEK